jgi:hypothetical protein
METSKTLIQRLIAPDGKVIAIATSTVTTDSQHPTLLGMDRVVSLDRLLLPVCRCLHSFLCLSISPNIPQPTPSGVPKVRVFTGCFT